MIDRQEFVANTAIVLISHGKSPDQAAADAEALALNLEKRNVSMWKRERPILVEVYQAGEPVLLESLLEYARKRLAGSVFPLPPLPSGLYQVTVTALDKRPQMP